MNSGRPPMLRDLMWIMKLDDKAGTSTIPRYADAPTHARTRTPALHAYTSKLTLVTTCEGGSCAGCS